MLFIRGDKLNDKQMNFLYKLHRKVYDYTELFDIFKSSLKNFYVLVDDANSVNVNILGYVNVELIKNTLKIIWIYGPGYGKMIMANIEHHFKQKKVKKIVLNCSVDPTEKKETVLRRLNFYIKMQYRVTNITFRDKHGLLLFMEKQF